MTDDKDINALRYYVTRLEEDFVNADLEAERLRKHNSKQALDIATLGQEVARLRKALECVIRIAHRDCPEFRAARAALAEQEKK